MTPGLRAALCGAAVRAACEFVATVLDCELGVDDPMILAHDGDVVVSSSRAECRAMEAALHRVGLAAARADFVELEDGEFDVDAAQVRAPIADVFALMTRVVGTGCALSALVAAFTASAPNRLNAVAAACAMAGLCGERAAASCRGPGSFKADFLDALYRLSPETLRGLAGEIRC